MSSAGIVGDLIVRKRKTWAEREWEMFKDLFGAIAIWQWTRHLRAWRAANCQYDGICQCAQSIIGHLPVTALTNPPKGVMCPAWTLMQVNGIRNARY